MSPKNSPTTTSIPRRRKSTSPEKSPTQEQSTALIMPGSSEPLLARDPPSADDQAIAEEDALLTGQNHGAEKRRETWRRAVEIGMFTWAVIATVIVIILAILFNQTRRTQQDSIAPTLPQGKRNLIFMVSDGMGPSSVAMTRSFRQYSEGLPYDAALTLDQYVVGQSRTRSTTSLITDSAAGATAFSCGMKSYNGAISTLPDHTPCGTVMEAAKKAGYMTGLVVTTRITDATPACFAAHVNKREEEDRIAEQLLGNYPLGQTVDLLFGAGRCHFLANTTSGSCRADNKDLVQIAKDKGFQYIDDRAGFDSLNLGSSVNLPILGLFADVETPYEIDRRQENEIYPALHELAQTALRALQDATRDSDKGFFLMIEGSRIDHSLHANDPATTVHEIIEYDRTFQTVLEFLERDSTDGIVVSTSDHDTGGLATARQLDPYIYPEYLWHPPILANVSHSTEWLAEDYTTHLASYLAANTPSSNPPSAHDTITDPSAKSDAATYLQRVLPLHLGITDITPTEIDEILSHPPIFAPWMFANLVSSRTQIGYTTHGHSGADVNIYASNAKAAEMLRGNVENTEVGVFLRTYLDVDVEAVTEELRRSGTGPVDGGEGDGANSGRYFEWMGQTPEDGERLDGQAHLGNEARDAEMQNDHGHGHEHDEFAHDHSTSRFVRCEVCGM